METLAYLHLALANEAPEDTKYNWDSLKLLDSLNQQKLSTSAAYSLLSLTVALGVLAGMASQASALIKEGDRGSEVTVLQQRLQRLGYFKANVTGYFGSLTREAVIRFQQAKGLTPDGMVGKTTSASLGESRKSRPKRVNQYSGLTLRLGARGEQVSLLQESLAVAGFSNNGAEGIFDEATEAAVRQFQEANRLTVDGIVGEETLAALPAIGGLNPTSTPRYETSRFDVQALQKRLKEQGFYRGEIDGVWGSRTQAAVEAAQRAYRVSAADIQNGRY